ncbi:conserved hypothetical protein [uncultured Desulfobacterium sp.]|uniref:Uncharacterized protein n=1 Tax=uncultured Desulfobacterium sp. TaxID=201089 RepID=A0A445MVC5_9BACT|nr:conserved hypothetical protein [uncultured Desulfobacterium sp.]
MNRKDVTISSPIEKKIAWAEECYRTSGNRLLEDRRIAELLSKVKAAVEQSRSAMMETEMVDVCRRCEMEEGGSCCGLGMEDKYDDGLLLMNLLMGLTLPKKRWDERSCYFLADTGCLLKVRHVICVNYICKKITDRVKPEELKALKEKEGLELDAVFVLHEELRRKLKDGGH